MRKLKVINSYTDKELAKNMVVGFEFETSEERAKVLIDKDFCIEIDVAEELYKHTIEVNTDSDTFDGITKNLEFKQPKQRKPRIKKQ